MSNYKQINLVKKEKPSYSPGEFYREIQLAECAPEMLKILKEMQRVALHPLSFSENFSLELKKLLANQ